MTRQLGDFIGVWQVQREIHDTAAGQVITAEGRAEFRPDGEGALIYDEALDLRLPNMPKPLQATRRYVWRDLGAGMVQVCFDDMRHFHHIDLTAPTPQDSHDCPPDWYDGSYDLRGWPRWSATWRVKGPRKNYTMITEFGQMGQNGD